jgi:hypothetical protein
MDLSVKILFGSWIFIIFVFGGLFFLDHLLNGIDTWKKKLS